VESGASYDAVTYLTEESFCKDLAAGRFNNSIIFPADRVATSWKLDDISFNGGAADRTMADLFTTELQAAAAIAIWTKEATQRCYTWNVGKMRKAYHDPEMLAQRDKGQMVSDIEGMCDLLKNLDLLVPKFDRHLANRLTSLHNNEVSVAADFSNGVKKADSKGKPEGKPVRGQEQMSATSQMYLLYVLCRWHFIRVGCAWCKLTFSEVDLCK
jgi:hypothetical protein